MKKKKNAAQSGQMSLESLLEQKEGQQTLFAPSPRHGIRGGYRAGSGRPRKTPAGAKQRCVRATDTEWAAMLAVLTQMRQKASEEKTSGPAR